VTSREELIRLMAQWWECPPAVAAEAFSRNLAAWKQAMAEYGVPEHPAGECPSVPCPCAVADELVTARAYELLGLRPGENEETR
jgi:hypothetical protein